MDAERFGAAIRRVTISGSRRVVLGIGLTHLLSLLGTRSSQARKRKKKCKKKCGPCEKCKKGKCKNTASGKEACGGKCVPACLSTPDLVAIRNPLTCGCCVPNGQSLGGNFCPAIDLCCSARCSSGVCIALDQGEACDFDAQCASEDCENGECA
jgi:hypothetical protein